MIVINISLFVTTLVEFFLPFIRIIGIFVRVILTQTVTFTEVTFSPSFPGVDKENLAMCRA